MYGLTNEGYDRKRLPEILEEKNQLTRSALGESINLDPQQPDGQINGGLSISDAFLWELAEAVNNAYDPNSATGKALDKLLEISGLTRLGAENSTVTLTITGDPFTVIPAGSVVNDGGEGADWETLEEITIPSLGNLTTQAQSVEAGIFSAGVGSITEIVTPVGGWVTVNNLAESVDGRDLETDAEARFRRNQSVAFSGLNMLESIIAGVGNVDGVISSRVYENDLDSVDSDGLIPHSIHVIAQGGDQVEIAQSIFDRKASGISMNGDITQNINDSQGLPHDILFSRPDEVPIYVDMTIAVTGDFPSDGVTQIKNNFVAWANGTLEGSQGCGLEIGGDVYYSQLYYPANSVGCSYYVTSLTSGTAPSPIGTVNIEILFDELATIEIANINVTVM